MDEWIQDEVERVTGELPDGTSETRYAALIHRLRVEWPDAELEEVARCVARTRTGLAVAAFIAAWSTQRGTSRYV